MGIEGLFKRVGKGQFVTPKFFRNRRVMVDGYNFLFQVNPHSAFTAIVYNDLRNIIRGFEKILAPVVAEAQHTLLVWDGKALPPKSLVSLPRIIEREEKRVLAEQLLKMGNKSQAKKVFKRGFELSKVQVIEVCVALQQRFRNCESKFSVLFSPYEGDQQMAYLYRSGCCDILLSSDSDMLLYGVPIIRDFKPDGGDYYSTEMFQRYKDKIMKERKLSEEFFFLDQLFQGCDYLKVSLWLKIKNGNTLWRRDPPSSSVIGSIQRQLQALLVACFQYDYQTVYDPITNRCVNLNLIPQHLIPLMSLLPNNVIGEKYQNSYQAATGLQYSDCAVKLTYPFKLWVDGLCGMQRQTILQKVIVSDALRIQLDQVTKLVSLGSEFKDVDIDINSIYDDYMLKQTVELQKKMNYVPKQYKQHFERVVSIEDLISVDSEKIEEKEKSELDIDITDAELPKSEDIPIIIHPKIKPKCDFRDKERSVIEQKSDIVITIEKPKDEVKSKYTLLPKPAEQM